MDVERQVHRADDILADAIKRRLFPGAVVLIAHRGNIIHQAAYGTTMYDDPSSQPVTTDTIYDIASLTKMFTATAALQLYDTGVLDLDAPAASYLPGLRASGVLIRHLLTHTSGLSLRLSSLRDSSPDDIRAAIYALEPAEPPGTRVAYVNVNTLILGDIVARIAGKPLDGVISDLILNPLGMQTTRFCPPQSWHAHTAPTEVDTEWRARLVQGHVHDESTWALGGVAGHAGLFSTAQDIWRFMQMWLDSASTNASTHTSGIRLLRPETVAQATYVQTAGLQLPTEGLAFHCGLGWMKEHPIIMAQAPSDTYGHTGFTGPTMVVVPSYALCLVILSNRIYPHRGPATHHKVMARLVYTALTWCNEQADAQRSS